MVGLERKISQGIKNYLSFGEEFSQKRHEKKTDESNFSSSVLKPCKNIIYALNIDIVCHKCYNNCSPFWTDTISKTTECILCGSFLFPQKAEDFHLRAVEVGGLHCVNARGVDA